MFVIIDIEQMRMVAAARKRTHIELIREVDFPDIHSLTCNSDDGGSWTVLSRSQMDKLYRNMSGMDESPEYGEATEQLRAYVKTWTDYHKSEQELVAELQALTTDEDDIPANDPIRQQINANRIMRAAHQAAIEACEGANGAAGGPGAQPLAKDEGQAAQAAPAARKAPAKAAPMQGVTKRVWEIGDTVYDPNTSLKIIRKKIMELCQAEGINPGTAATQYGRWKLDRGYA